VATKTQTQLLPNGNTLMVKNVKTARITRFSAGYPWSVTKW